MYNGADNELWNIKATYNFNEKANLYSLLNRKKTICLKI